MRYNTQLNIRNRLIENVNRIYREAINYRYFHSDEVLQQTVAKVYNDADYRRLPQYQHSYIRGYIDALNDQLWTKMTWVFPWYGQIYDSWTDLPDDAREFYKQPHNAGFHVYKTSRDVCFTGSQEAFDLLYAGGIHCVKRAGEINFKEEERREREREERRLARGDY